MSATTRSASSWRSILSVRQSLASSIAERSRLPRCSSSFASKREKSAKASAEEPAKPARTSPPFRRRIFAAVCFMTVVPERDLAVRRHRDLARRGARRPRSSSATSPSPGGYSRQRSPQPYRRRPPRAHWRRQRLEPGLDRGVLLHPRGRPAGPRPPRPARCPCPRSSSRPGSRSRRRASQSIEPSGSRAGARAAARHARGRLADERPDAVRAELQSERLARRGRARVDQEDHRQRLVDRRHEPLSAAARSCSSRRRSTARAGTSAGCWGRSRRCCRGRRGSDPRSRSSRRAPAASGRSRPDRGADRPRRARSPRSCPTAARTRRPCRPGGSRARSSRRARRRPPRA